MAKRPPASEVWNKEGSICQRALRKATAHLFAVCSWIGAKFWIWIIICHVFSREAGRTTLFNLWTPAYVPLKGTTTPFGNVLSNCVNQSPLKMIWRLETLLVYLPLPFFSPLLYFFQTAPSVWDWILKWTPPSHNKYLEKHCSSATALASVSAGCTSQAVLFGEIFQLNPNHPLVTATGQELLDIQSITKSFTSFLFSWSIVLNINIKFIS